MRITRRLFLTTALAALLGIGAFVGVSSINSEKPVEVTEASGTIASGQTLISLKNSGWTDAGVKTAVYFWNNSGHGWSSKYVTEFPVYDSGNSIYIVDVPSGEWTSYKCVRINPTGCPSTPSDSCWDYNWGESGNFSFGTNNTLEPVINGGFNYNTDWKLESGLPIYLDLNGQDWTAANAVVCAYFWGNTVNTSTTTKLQMNNVHGWDNNNVNLYEVCVPGSGYWSNVLFYRADSVDGSWYNQTADLKGNSSNNVYKLTGYESGSWDWDFSDDSRAAAYGTYFNTCVVCNGSGSITTDNWSLAKAEYNCMSEGAQYIVWDSDTSPSGTDLQKAMSKYDYIIHKYAAKMSDDFIKRHTSSHYPYGSVTQPLVGLSTIKDSGTTIAIIVVSSIAIAAVGGYFLFKKKKQD